MFLRTALLIFVAGVVLLVLQVVVRSTPEPLRVSLKIDGVVREAIIYPPAKLDPHGAPVVFGFHGQGSGPTQAAKSFQIQDIWPEAVVVYPGGLGGDWMSEPGEAGDRDLKFFDALLAEVRRTYQTDPRRTYATGHDNGAVFTYLLSAVRPGLLAAIAPSAGGFARGTAARPIPVMHIAGEQDSIAPLNVQEQVMTLMRRINGCEAAPLPWGVPPVTGCQFYPSGRGTPFVAFIHRAGHVYPSEAPALVVRFFQEHPAPPRPPAA